MIRVCNVMELSHYIRTPKANTHIVILLSYTNGRIRFCYSCPPLSVPNDMISRRRILSRSRDDLNLDSGVGFPVQVEEEEDVWYNKDKLYKVRRVYHNIHFVVCFYFKVVNDIFVRLNVLKNFVLPSRCRVVGH